MSFRNILISCLFYFVVNNYYSHDCCKKINNCCCDCFTFNDDVISLSNKNSESKSQVKEEGGEEEEEEEHGSNEKEKKYEINNDQYLEEVSKNFDKVKIIKEDFLKKQEPYKIETSGTKNNDGVLGNGSFGCAYKIKNKNNGEIFVLKKTITNKGELRFTRNEIQNLIRLKDEQNILRIVDVYRQNNFIGDFLEKEYSEKDNAVCFYIITEYCKNGDLYDFIENKKISDKENLRNKIAYQIINAVHSCHSQHIAHRDLKPKNIFLDKDWNVKLGDFGLSDNFEYDGKDSSIVGSLRYMCYEIIQNLAYNPFKADLYSLGVILYELYTGISYSEGERKFPCKKGKKPKKVYRDDFYTNENVECKLNKNLADEKYNNLKILLTGLLQQFEKYRWGWDDILKSEFYKSLDNEDKNK